MHSAATVELTGRAPNEDEKSMDSRRAKPSRSSVRRQTSAVSPSTAGVCSKCTGCVHCGASLGIGSACLATPSIHFFRRRDVVLTIVHIFFLIVVFLLIGFTGTV